MHKDSVLTLKQWRNLRGYTQAELSKCSGISEKTIWNLENDNNCLLNSSFKTVFKIAKALDIKVANIFFTD
ncbi:helix-turn-helix transcriptional regulator [Staphylococcus shinii]|uniref:helix-turn-helix transcriptional regulator n=1 Tax=Staphylococcus shinii TaxID=2912228 RepID=UPI00384C44F0